jgi:hypothetical protein
VAKSTAGRSFTGCATHIPADGLKVFRNSRDEALRPIDFTPPHPDALAWCINKESQVARRLTG